MDSTERIGNVRKGEVKRLEVEVRKDQIFFLSLMRHAPISGRIVQKSLVLR